MKLNQWMSMVGVAICVAASSAFGQTNLNSVAPTRSGQEVVPEKLTVNDANTASNLRPSRPERQNIPPKVKERIERFKGEARAYLEKREALKKQLQGANDTERAAIRESIKQLREQWLDKAREMQRELKDRANELRTQLPEMDEVLREAREASQQTATEGPRDRPRQRE